MRLTQFGAVDLPYEEAEDQIPLGAKSSLSPLRDGSFDLLNGQFFTKPRQFTRSFVLIDTATQTIRERIDELSAEFIQGAKVLRAETRDGLKLQTFAKVNAVNFGYGLEQLGRQPMSLTFEIPTPFFFASDDEPEYLNDGLVLDGSWTLNAGHVETEVVTASPHNFAVSNTGVMPILRGLLQLAPQSGGSIQNPKIENTTNGHWVKWAGTLTDTDTLDIQWLTQAILLNSVGDYANLSRVTTKEDWMRLEVGSNSISVTADSVVGNVDLYWQWSRQYPL